MLDQARNQAAAPGPTAYIVQAMRAMDQNPARAILLSKNLGLRAFAEPEGLRVVLGVDLNSSSKPKEALKSVKVSLGRPDGSPLKPLLAENCLVEGVTVFNTPAEPGPYRLRVERPGEWAEFAVVAQEPVRGSSSLSRMLAAGSPPLSSPR